MKLHLIAFDIPYPPDYGGVMDIFYKIKALFEQGAKITLHCFQYGGRTPAPELNELCEKVYYYPRQTDWITGAFKSLAAGLPYIVVSRNDQQLLANLLQDNSPIIFEGLHTSFFLDFPEFENRFKIVRLHNIEHHYYKSLADAENSLLRKAYYTAEAKMLAHWEKQLNCANVLLPISLNDFAYFSTRYGKCTMMYPFHPNETVKQLTGNGDFILYHGNLSVSENHQAAMYLVKELNDASVLPLMIAGRNPHKELQAACNKYGVRLVENPDDTTMQWLMEGAHIHLLFTMQATGTKLKLLNALYTGRHCVANNKMVEGSGLASLCHLADTKDGLKSLLNDLSLEPFTAEQWHKRKYFLETNYSNAANAKTLLSLLPS